ncbi:SMI1/KNR4 family protein [Microcoleus sp. FACHB-672]|uniref:SMI1/KNR4 family protein n=1 Tax=Microcoleus sp. FACHB-672 TaxID=2692825 RepID=UPI001683BB4F|nr:SMI1/KNR4 family protein [Microcoleus sp. FACHB-672]MBD2041432.1 SMI1/KNR4 family protein [Microcoleus sp. FACHB-672]
MEIVWERIHNWLKANAPQVLESLRSGATDEEIYQAEVFFNVKFPEDFKLSYCVHNGQEEESYCLFPHLDFLSLERAIEISKKWQDCSDDNFKCDPEDISKEIWNGWWNPNWIPLTMESNGACECIDLDPSADGNVGQVIIVEWREPDRLLIAPNLRVYLETFAEALERGEYWFSEDYGGLVDKKECS